MPRFDGSGPGGIGPMTGRGMGPCGGGRAFGRGRGLRMMSGWGCFPNKMVKWTETDEKKALTEEAKMLEEELAEVKKRISELEK